MPTQLKWNCQQINKLIDKRGKFNEVQIVFVCVFVCLLKNFPFAQCIRMENFQTNGNNAMISSAATS